MDLDLLPIDQQCIEIPGDGPTKPALVPIVLRRHGPGEPADVRRQGGPNHECVQVAGVVVGEVSAIKLNEDNLAQLTLRVDNQLKIPQDSIVSVKSQGIIGDKYIQISLGGDPEVFKADELILETESAVDIESLISKFAFGSAK